MHVRLTLAVAGAFLLAACSEDPEPTPKILAPTPTSSAPSPSDSKTPEAESPENFIRRWVQAGDEMQVTGRTDEYDRMTLQCAPCQSFVENVEDVYSAGGSAEFAGSRVVQIERVGDAPPTYNLTKDLPETVIKRPGHPDQKLPGGRTTVRVTLGQADGAWVVKHFGIL